MEIERRTNTVELRVISSDTTKPPVIKGYGAKFRTLSEPMPIMRDGEKVGTFREQLMPGCFASAIPTSDVRSLFNHDPNLILGRTTSGTMRVAEDEVGLDFEVDPPDTTYARNLEISMRRKDITQCSFGFSVAEGGDSFTKDSMPGTWIRSIHKIARLYDVSPVTYPAYVDTNCAMRSALSAVATEEADIQKRVAEQQEEEKRTAEKAEADAAALLEEEQRKAAELVEQEEANKLAEEQRSAEKVKLELDLLKLELD